MGTYSNHHEVWFGLVLLVVVVFIVVVGFFFGCVFLLGNDPTYYIADIFYNFKVTNHSKSVS